MIEDTLCLVFIICQQFVCVSTEIGTIGDKINFHSVSSVSSFFVTRVRIQLTHNENKDSLLSIFEDVDRHKIYSSDVFLDIVLMRPVICYTDHVLAINISSENRP
jgi:hypothetical protein